MLERDNASGPDALADGRRYNGLEPNLLTPEGPEAVRLRPAAPPPDGGLWSSGKVSKPPFAGLLAAFAEEIGAGPTEHVVLLLDNAAFHARPNPAVPDGIRLVDLPPHSPELQPADVRETAP